MRLKCVANFINNKRKEIKDMDTLAKIVFENSTVMTVKEGKEKLEEVIAYYKEALKVSQSARVTSKGKT